MNIPRVCPACRTPFESRGSLDTCSATCAWAERVKSTAATRERVAAGLTDAKRILAAHWWLVNAEERETLKRALDAVVQAERTLIAADKFMDDATRPRPLHLFKQLARACSGRLSKVRVKP